MLQLPTVTLCCLDTRNHALALRSLARSCGDIRFARVLFLTDAVPRDLAVPAEVEVRSIGTIASRSEYSRFILKGLVEHIETEHALVTQWDGYITHPEAWDAAFLDCDYIGAPWTAALDDRNVGNGGFSLRSRRLLEALRDPRIDVVMNEDQEICGRFRELLEHEYRIRFGKSKLARYFSFEIDPSHVLGVGPTFGFHGLFNFFLVESQPEISSLAPRLSDEIARSAFCGLLLSNCVNYKQWDAAIALADRMLGADPANERTAELLVTAKAHRDHERAQEMTSAERQQGFLRRWITRK